MCNAKRPAKELGGPVKLDLSWSCGPTAVQSLALSLKWGMRFQPVKCNIMQISRKRIKKVNASYNSEGTVLDNIKNIKYLGITITDDLKWNTVSNICTKANRTLGFLRCNLSACPQDVKESWSMVV